MTSNNKKQHSSEDTDMNKGVQPTQNVKNSDGDFSSGVDAEYLRSAILWRKAINESKDKKNTPLNLNDELAEERAWKAFQAQKNQDKKKENKPIFKQPYIFAMAASIIIAIIAIPLYQQYSSPLEQEEYKVKGFIVYDPYEVNNPLEVGTQLKEELENLGFSVLLFNDNNVVSLDISIKQKLTKKSINYLQSKNITLDRDKKAHIQFLPLSN